MATQLLIYETAVPITQARHAQWSVDAGGNYAFSQHVNSVPLMVAEFARAQAEYPVIFAGSETAIMPAVILGMRGGENLYLDGQHQWKAKYVPAFVRRYPFVFSASADGATFTLCVDEAFAGCNQEGRGERLFDDAGKPTPYVQSVLRFLQGYQAEFGRTQAFCRKLQALDVFEPMQAQINLASGQTLSLTGFMSVNREKLHALPAETLAELAKSGELELVYLHLNSMQHFESLRERLDTAAQPAEAAAAA
ncbi:MAG: SapC family protein [Candidatus Methylumidiphilus sp.]